jgi:hypothetical protein
MQSIDDKIISTVYGHGRGFVFTPKLFSSLGDLRVVGTALTRLCRKGTIRRLARGLYDYPRKHPQLGLLSPSIDDVANLFPSMPYCHWIKLTRNPFSKSISKPVMLRG